MAIGLLLIRWVFGALMAAHGSQKLFAWFGGYGLTGTGTFFEQLAFRPGRLFAAAAGWTEVLGGVLVAVGLGGPTGDDVEDMRRTAKAFGKAIPFSGAMR